MVSTTKSEMKMAGVGLHLASAKGTHDGTTDVDSRTRWGAAFTPLQTWKNRTFSDFAAPAMNLNREAA